jgi:acetyl esterase/lipase
MGLQTLLDIPCGSANGRVLSLDVLRPARDSGAALPVVLWLHGGGWYSGSKRNVIDKHVLDFLVRSGFVLASAEYRLSDEAPFPAQIHDVKAAIRWLRAQPEVLGIDPERVALAGFSAGGHLAALAATTVGVPELEGESGSPGYSTRVQAAIAMAAPTDFTQNPAASDPSLNPNSVGGVTPEQRLLGGRIEDRGTLARLANPAAFIGRDMPPILLIHGSEDEIVPVSQAEYLYQALEGRGIEVTLIRVEGGNHGCWPAGQPYPSTPIPPRLERWMLAFLAKHLQGKPGFELRGVHRVHAKEIDQPPANGQTA